MSAAPSAISALDSVIQQLQACDFPEFFGKLRDRWQDESEYENFADYKTAIAARLPRGYTVTKLTRRPFRCHVKAGAFPGYVFCLTATSSRLSWAHTLDDKQ